MQDLNQFQKNKHTLNNQSMPQNKERYTNFVNNFSKNSKKPIKGVSFLRKPRLFKVLAASGLALFMGIGTLCGALIAPINGSAAASMASQSSQTGQQADKNASANLSAENQAKAELDAQILAGDSLGLNPKNDPVVYTNEKGLNIKFHFQTFESGILNGYAYFTMGNYNGADVNWIIIGRSELGFDINTKLLISAFLGLVDSSILPCDNNDPVYRKLKDESYQDIIINSDNYYFNTLSPSDELSSGEVLCLSETILCNTSFSTTGQNSYGNSALNKKMISLYNDDLNFTEQEKMFIVPKNLTQGYIYGQNSVSQQYLFPLASNRWGTSTFIWSKYLNDSKAATSGTWWLRCGHFDYSPWFYFISGSGSQSAAQDTSRGVRPAMVIKLN